MDHLVKMTFTVSSQAPGRKMRLIVFGLVCNTSWFPVGVPAAVGFVWFSVQSVSQGYWSGPCMQRAPQSRKGLWEPCVDFVLPLSQHIDRLAALGNQGTCSLLILGPADRDFQLLSQLVKQSRQMSPFIAYVYSVECVSRIQKATESLRTFHPAADPCFDEFVLDTSKEEILIKEMCFGGGTSPFWVRVTVPVHVPVPAVHSLTTSSLSLSSPTTYPSWLSR